MLADLDEVTDLREHGYLRAQIVDLDVDRVDLDHRDIDEDVGPLRDVLRIDDRIILDSS